MRQTSHQTLLKYNLKFILNRNALRRWCWFLKSIWCWSIWWWTQNDNPFLLFPFTPAPKMCILKITFPACEWCFAVRSKIMHGREYENYKFNDVVLRIPVARCACSILQFHNVISSISWICVSALCACEVIPSWVSFTYFPYLRYLHFSKSHFNFVMASDAMHLWAQCELRFLMLSFCCCPSWYPTRYYLIMYLSRVKSCAKNQDTIT